MNNVTIESCCLCKNFKYGRGMIIKRKKRWNTMDQKPAPATTSITIGTSSGKKNIPTCDICKKDGLYALPNKMWCIY